MTDKEQIMINGVDVSGCEYLTYQKQLARSTQRIKDLEERIINHSNEIEEYCSRLADKDKECEELKKYIKEDLAPHAQVLQKENDNLKEKFKKFFGIDNQECWDIAFLKDENARYRKALEEIEKVLSHCIMTGAIVKILTIIRKAKGEE